MASTNERVAVLEIKVDELKETVKVNDVELKQELKKMYDASCAQHASLGKDLNELKSFRDNWLARLAGAGFILGPIVGWIISTVDWTTLLNNAPK